ncbi:hypothetical protein GCM10009663_45110 [Kitasatospora arboriphila]|uniref:Uncharacterized protein n=1 Tax=Kitasatospora arboriphila TaxID=258052 RepID=A0ABN1TQ47_9ACTN
MASAAAAGWTAVASGSTAATPSAAAAADVRRRRMMGEGTYGVLSGGGGTLTCIGGSREWERSHLLGIDDTSMEQSELGRRVVGAAGILNPRFRARP